MGITPQQFAQLTQRLARRQPAPAILPNPSPTEIITILGIDPSLRGTGYGVIRTTRPVPTTLAQGTIHCPASWIRSRCLMTISEKLRELAQAHAPTVCAIEGLFFAQNMKTALIMGEARGAAMAAVATAGLDIFEIAPRKMKQAIVGYGGAQKMAVAKMVQRMLGLAKLPAPDAADALALALVLAHEQGRRTPAQQKRI